MIFSDYEEPELKDRSDEMGQLIAYVMEQQKHNSNTEQPEVHHESKEEVTANVAADKNAVYNLQGVKVANRADALRNLPAGVYVVNGKKVLVR